MVRPRPIHSIYFQPRFSILDKVSLAVILELVGCKNDKTAIQQLEKVQNETGKLLEKVQKVEKKLLEKVQKSYLCSRYETKNLR